MDPYSSINTRRSPQSEQADERQVPNSTGGFVFSSSDDARLRRFLILGSAGGSYYASERDLTKENAEVLLGMAQRDPVSMVNTIVEISLAGRAPKVNPALFALAVVAGTSTEAGRQYALSMLGDVARTGTHLFTFVGYVRQFRGWGRSVKNAVARWYLDKDVDALAYQMVKYRQREGWTHRDLLRISHPATADPTRNALLRWATSGEAKASRNGVPALVDAFEVLQEPSLNKGLALSLIASHPISWEMLPEHLLGDRDVWAELVDKGMPITALIRQLPRLTRLGLLDGDRGRMVEARITNLEVLRKGRVHPLNVLVAQKTYASGASARGDGTWAPVRRIVDALDQAFYVSFGAVEPTGKRMLLALDVSGSMTCGIANMPITAREASAALALVTASTESDYEIVGFTGGGTYGWGRTEITPLSISPRQRLDDVVKSISNLPFGQTDCSLPMVWAKEHGVRVDAFVTYTDSETNVGRIHPHQALREYRQASGIAARNVVVGMVSNGFTVNDPADELGLDVVGFDSATPQLISDFVRGDV